MSSKNPDKRPKSAPTPVALGSDDTDVDPTVIDRELRLDTEPTAVEPAPLSDEETLGEGAVESTESEEVFPELSQMGESLAKGWSAFGAWVLRTYRPAARIARRQWGRLVDFLRRRRPEDSDAYARRRGQQWRRFKEGDPSINELGDFAKKYRPPDDSKPG